MSQQRRHYEDTDVPESKSQQDTQTLLRQHGVTMVRWTTTANLIRLEFSWPYRDHELGFRLDLHVPAKDAAGNLLEPDRREQEARRLYRVLLYHVKAKLIAVEEGLVPLEQEFLPYLIGEGDRTMGDVVREQLAAGALANARPLLESGLSGA